MEIYEHPDITAALWLGYPKQRQPTTCPVCGEECEDIYLGFYNRPVGCNVCTRRVDAAEYLEENDG